MKAAQTKTLAPVVLWTNQPAINHMDGKLKNILPLAENLTAEYFKLPFARPEADLNHIINVSGQDAKAYHLSLIPDSIEMGALRLNKQAAINAGLFQEPEYPEFAEAKTALLNTDFTELQQYFKIQDQAATINPAAWGDFVSRNNIAARTPEELEMYQVWSDFLNSAMALDKYFRKNVDQIILEGLAPIQLNRLALPLAGGGLTVNHAVFQALSKRLSINTKN